MAPQGMSRVADLLAVLLGEDETTLPPLARQALRGLAAELEALGKRVDEIEAAILVWHKESDASRRLAAIPGTACRAEYGGLSRDVARLNLGWATHDLLHRRAPLWYTSAVLGGAGRRNAADPEPIDGGPGPQPLLSP